jgi:hypothetical protein
MLDQSYYFKPRRVVFMAKLNHGRPCFFKTQLDAPDLFHLPKITPWQRKSSVKVFTKEEIEEYQRRLKRSADN